MEKHMEERVEKYLKSMLTLLGDNPDLKAEQKMDLRRLYPFWVSANKKIMAQAKNSKFLAGILSTELEIEIDIRLEHLIEVVNMKSKEEYIAFMIPKINERFGFTQEEIEARNFYTPLCSKMATMINNFITQLLTT